MYIEPVSRQPDLYGIPPQGGAPALPSHFGRKFLKSLGISLVFMTGMLTGVYLTGDVTNTDLPQEDLTMHAAATYRDVPADHWAAGPIGWATATGIMRGSTSDPGLFEPSANANRASLASVMARLYDRVHAENSTLEAKVKTQTFIVPLTSTDPLGLTSKSRGSALLILRGKKLWYDIRTTDVSGDITVKLIQTPATGEATAIAEFTFETDTAQGVITVPEDFGKQVFAGTVSLSIHTTKTDASGKLTPEL